MTNQYSIEIHQYVTEKIKALEDQLAQAKKIDDPGSQRFLEGQLLEFLTFRDYMHEKIDLKTQDYF